MRIDLLETDVPAAVDAVLKKCGKTPYDLSEIAGVASGTIYNWRLGAFDPRLPQFMWFLDAAGARLIIEMDEDTKRELTIEKLPEIIKDLIDDTGLSHLKVSEKSELGAETVRNWKLGRGNPRLEQLLWFLDAVGYRLVVERKEENAEN